MTDHGVDTDIGPEIERELRTELHGLAVPAAAPPQVHARVERLTVEALAGKGAPSWRQRLRPRAFLLAEIGAVVVLLAAGAGVIALRTTLAPALATPHPTLEGTPGPTFPPPPSGPSTASTGAWIASDSGLDAYVVLGSTGLRMTTDGGASWSETRTLPAPPDLGLEFFDAGTGYTMRADEVATNGAVTGSRLVAYRTADGGRTWQPSGVGIVPRAADESLSAQIHYADPEHGVVLATTTYEPPRPTDPAASAAPLELRACRLFTTDDAGASWSASPEVACVGPLLAWETGLLGYALSACPSCPFAVTEDGGRTWTTSTLPGVSADVAYWPRLLLADGPGRLRLVGGYVRTEGGETLPRPLVVLTSSDGGATWTEDHRSSAVDGPSLNSIWSFDAEHWMALHEVSIEERPFQATQLIETWDAGRTWDVVDSSGFNSAGTMSWADRRHGMLQGVDMGDCSNPDAGCGGSGTIFLTNDGGRTWHPVPF